MLHKQPLPKGSHTSKTHTPWDPRNSKLRMAPQGQNSELTASACSPPAIMKRVRSAQRRSTWHSLLEHLRTKFISPSRDFVCDARCFRRVFSAFTCFWASTFFSLGSCSDSAGLGGTPLLRKNSTVSRLRIRSCVPRRRALHSRWRWRAVRVVARLGVDGGNIVGGRGHWGA